MCTEKKRRDPAYVVCHSEEGARFPSSTVASGVWAEAVPLEQAHSLQEVGGGKATMREELEKIGYLGDRLASYKHSPLYSHFELHIGIVVDIFGQTHINTLIQLQSKAQFSKQRIRESAS